MENIVRNPINWVEIYVDDIERAKKFYSTVLQKQLQDANTDGNCQMVFLPGSENCDAPNACGALVKHDKIKAGGNSVIVYFQSEDCQVEQDRVEAAGGKIMMPKFSIGEHGFASWCIDTEGNIFGLHSMK